MQLLRLSACLGDLRSAAISVASTASKTGKRHFVIVGMTFEFHIIVETANIITSLLVQLLRLLGMAMMLLAIRLLAQLFRLVAQLLLLLAWLLRLLAWFLILASLL